MYIHAQNPSHKFQTQVKFSYSLPQGSNVSLFSLSKHLICNVAKPKVKTVQGSSRFTADSLSAI